MEFVETSVFTRQIAVLLGDDDYRALQALLSANPGAGNLIRGGGGLRKVRIGVGARGKRGGARVIYYWAVRKHQILFLLPTRRMNGTISRPGRRHYWPRR